VGERPAARREERVGGKARMTAEQGCWDSDCGVVDEWWYVMMGWGPVRSIEVMVVLRWMGPLMDLAAKRVRTLWKSVLGWGV